MATISAVLGVYNEEARIEATLRCALWCDEIVVLDKQSTDHTREIAQRYTNKVYKIPYSEFDPNELQGIVDSASGEWILWLTASEVMHPVLATQIRELIERDDFPYDVIHVPYRCYVLGLETRRSPWYSKVRPVVFRKRVVKIHHDSVHAAVDFDTKRHYKMANSTEHCMYHLTHETVDIMMEHHLRYCRAEGRLFPPDSSMGKAALSIPIAIYQVFVQRKTFLMGWNGISLGAAYLSYFLLRFVYIWEHRHSEAPNVYQQIRSSILRAWDSHETHHEA
jgi:glycosyltransferase involved in cell wall biosynthesis